MDKSVSASILKPSHPERSPRVAPIILQSTFSLMRMTFSTKPLIVFLVLTFIGCGSRSGDSSKSSSQSDTIRPATAIDRDSLFYMLEAVDSTTVFDLTVKYHYVEYDVTPNGNFVFSIDSIDQGNDYFWVYAVNDTMGQVASNIRIIDPGNRIVWHYRLITR